MVLYNTFFMQKFKKTHFGKKSKCLNKSMLKMHIKSRDYDSKNIANIAEYGNIYSAIFRNILQILGILVIFRMMNMTDFAQ